MCSASSAVSVTLYTVYAVHCRRRAEATEWLSQVRVPENVLRLQEVCQVRVLSWSVCEAAPRTTLCPLLLQAGGLGVTPFSDLEKEQLAGLVKRLDDMAEVSC